MKKIIVLLLLWVLVISTAMAQFSLKGRVTDQEGKPLSGAHVVLSGTFYGTSSITDGSFLFDHLKAGKYTLITTFIGFEEHKQEMEVDQNREVSITLHPALYYTGEVVVKAIRAGEKTPMAYTNLSQENLQGKNLGQDLPYLLQQTPSLVATSDAGTGIGYTGFRVRGTDMNRMNVTVNGIPLNDAESHSTFFVDQPDLVSSANVIQIQRGAGTSSSGGAAFGATINLQTLALKPDPYAELMSSAGSFNTFKGALSAGTGLISHHFSLDTRVSGIRSDGFIDRAFSDLKSMFGSAGYFSESSIVKVIAFTGWEETYQAWNGVPSVRLNNDLPGMKLYETQGLYSTDETARMIASNSRTFNLYNYKNQIDHYRQNNYQLHFSHRFSHVFNMNIALHYTFGKGYYEQFKANQKFSDYHLLKPLVNGTEISRTDLVRRKWLDNDFFGTVFSLNYSGKKADFSWGGGWNNYTGHHFGKIIWGQFLGAISPDHEWYRNEGVKSDFNLYGKMNYRITSGLNLFTDLQVRSISYEIGGTDDDLRQLEFQHDYSFFNPKVGLFYQLNSGMDLYASYARAHREPNRDNFVDTPPGGKLPGFETLNDMEAGWNFRSSSVIAGASLYYMFYNNQLVLTGQINDVGAPVMTNVDNSHRAGIELTGGISLSRSIRWDGNITLSRNKIKAFTEYVDDWDTWNQQTFSLGTTDLAFSPGITGNSQLSWKPGKFSLSLATSYTGKQFIDNTASADRILNAYWVNHLHMEYKLPSRLFSKISLVLQVNNLLNEEYESNAWVYSYFLGGKRYKMDGYFPQAGRNYLAGVSLSF
jgi:iron complex outermembrane recepter protein